MLKQHLELQEENKQQNLESRNHMDREKNLQLFFKNVSYMM